MACGEVLSKSMHRLHLSTRICAKVESSSKESGKKKKREADLGEVDVVQEIKKLKGKSTMTSFERKSKQIFRTEEHEKLGLKIAKFFYASGIPLNCVNNPEFGCLK